MFENKILRNKHGTKREEITGKWRRLLMENPTDSRIHPTSPE